MATVLTVTAVAAGVVTEVRIGTAGTYTVQPTNPVSQGSTSGAGVGTPTFTMYYGSGSNVLIGNAASVGRSYEHVIGASVRIENENDAGHTCYTNQIDFPAYNLEIEQKGTDNTFHRFEAVNAYVANIRDQSGGANVYLGTHPFGYFSAGDPAFLAAYNFWINGAARLIAPYADSAIVAGIRLSGFSGTAQVIGGSAFWGTNSVPAGAVGLILDSNVGSDFVTGFSATQLAAANVIVQTGLINASTYVGNNPGATYQTPILTSDGTSALPGLQLGTANTGFRGSSNAMSFITNGSFRGSATSGGALVWGSSGTARAFTSGSSGGSGTPLVQHQNNSATPANDGEALMSFSTGTTAPATLFLGQSASSTVGTQTAVASGTMLGGVEFHGSDGTAFRYSSLIRGEVDATVATNQVPGRIVFATATTGGTMTTALTIDSAQQLKPAPASWTANGSVATAMSSLGPAGSHTTVQEWFTIKSGANLRYVPAF